MGWVSPLRLWLIEFMPMRFRLRISSSCPDGTLGDEISPPVSCHVVT